MLTIAAYDRYVEQLLETVRRLAEALGQAGIDCRVIGGVAVFLHVHDRDADMDAVGLITSEAAAGLPDVLRARLLEVRAAE